MMLKMLIDTGLNVNNVKYQDNSGTASNFSTPLLKVLNWPQAYDSTIELLLNSKANLLVQTKGGAIPIIVATMKDRIRIMKKLFELQDAKSIFEPTSDNKWYPIYVVTSVEALEVLLAHGANVSQITANNWDILMCACEEGRFTVVKYLLENHRNMIDINHLNRPHLQSLLSLVAITGNLEIVALLIRNGASIPADTFGHICALNHIKMVKYFIQNYKNTIQINGFFTHISDHITTPLLAAVMGDHREVVKLLTNKGASPLLLDLSGMSAWDTALHFNRHEIVRHFEEL